MRNPDRALNAVANWLARHPFATILACIVIGAAIGGPVS